MANQPIRKQKIIISLDGSVLQVCYDADAPFKHYVPVGQKDSVLQKTRAQLVSLGPGEHTINVRVPATPAYLNAIRRSDS